MKRCMEKREGYDDEDRNFIHMFCVKTHYNS